MNPLVNVHYPTNTDADLDRLQKLAEQLSGFDERVSLEWLDGAMTALAAGPRPTTVAAWRDELLGEGWSRAFADPEADREATAVLETRWRVLLKQLDPELLMDAMDELRLAPVMLEWTDDDKAKLVEEGTIAAGSRTTRSRSRARSGRTASWTSCRASPTTGPSRTSRRRWARPSTNARCASSC